MKTLKEYLNLYTKSDIINEAKCSNNDYSKHNYAYVKTAIDILVNGKELKLGDKGTEGSVSINSLDDNKTKEIIQKLQDLSISLDNSISLPEDFNNIVKLLGLKWTNIFKGQLSGYDNGLESKNKGNAFEKYFKENYSKFESNIKKIVNYDKLNDITLDGGLNQKRPLTFKNNSITCGNINTFNIGKTVTDLTLHVDNNPKNDIYLSLKSGKTVTFINAGISKLFTKKFFDGEKLTGDAKTLLDMLCIDENKFRNVFLSYKDKHVQKARYDEINILDKIKNNKIFERFIKSVVGFGFILVHQIKGDNIEYFDFTTEDKLNKFISNINDAFVQYPQEGEAKRVNIVVKYDKIEFKLNIRSKNGGIYPTHLLADYTFI